MVLHLLGKKSWNVYNSTNVDRVRRDEAEANARQEAAEQRMQEEDAARRIALLKGESVPPPTAAEPVDDRRSWQQRGSDDTYASRDRKRRRLRGENDTDRDIRYAQQNAEVGARATQALLRGEDRDAPLHDHVGHIQLIPAPDEAMIQRAEKNAEAEAEKAKKRKREEDQYTMRFSNAAGNETQKLWYSSGKNTVPPVSTTDLVLADGQSKDVWGNEDPLRKKREHNRILANDPFAAMQQAQRQLKRSERDRSAWQRAQKAEIEQLRKEETHDRYRRRRRDNPHSLDDFSLDAPAADDKKCDRNDHDKHGEHRHHRRHEHRDRHRHRSRSQHDSHRHHSKDR